MCRAIGNESENAFAMQFVTDLTDSLMKRSNSRFVFNEADSEHINFGSAFWENRFTSNLQFIVLFTKPS